MPFFAVQELLWAGREFRGGELIAKDPHGNLRQLASVGAVLEVPSGHKIARASADAPWEIVRDDSGEFSDVADPKLTADLQEARSYIDLLESDNRDLSQRLDAAQAALVSPPEVQDSGELIDLRSVVKLVRDALHNTEGVDASLPLHEAIAQLVDQRDEARDIREAAESVTVEEQVPAEGEEAAKPKSRRGKRGGR